MKTFKEAVEAEALGRFFNSIHREERIAAYKNGANFAKELLSNQSDAVEFAEYLVDNGIVDFISTTGFRTYYNEFKRLQGKNNQLKENPSSLSNQNNLVIEQLKTWIQENKEEADRHGKLDKSQYSFGKSSAYNNVLLKIKEIKS